MGAAGRGGAGRDFHPIPAAALRPRIELNSEFADFLKANEEAGNTTWAALPPDRPQPGAVGVRATSADLVPDRTARATYLVSRNTVADTPLLRGRK